MDIPIELVKSSRAYKKSSTKRLALLSLVVALYAIVIPYAYLTAGEPRKAAIINAQNLADEKWAREALLGAASSNITSSDSSSIPSDNLAPAHNTSSLQSYSDIDDIDNPDIVDDPAQIASADSAASSSWFSSWFGQSKEARRAQKEQEELKKKFNALSDDGSQISLPPSYLPSAWACICLFFLLTFHALFHLMCHWVVQFKALMLFAPATKVDETAVILVTPPSNRGKEALVPVKKSSSTNLYVIEFQRQIYIYTPAARLGEAGKTTYKNGVFTLCACPVNLPVLSYLKSSGHRTETELELQLEKFGKNHLAVPSPSFLELLQIQLLSPLAIFQVFCSILWLLDEYWSYTLWTLASVVIFEATTVFQRTRTQAMLSSMAPKSVPIYAYRFGKWQVISTKDLLPGDVISLVVKRQPTPPASQAVAAPNSTADANPKPATPPNPHMDMNNIVPCDCLILKGSAVVNEASLTGESVPQMKESLNVDTSSNVASSGSSGDEERLDMNGIHRVSTLFSGTTLVTADNKQESDASSSKLSGTINSPPDNGIVAYVLRTGFSSSQGNLLQMIEFSQQSVAGDAKETGLALLLLFVFALIAAAYVMHEGLRKREKTTHELLLKCVIIITSVVPRQFPMQMAMAVNMALMSLNKAGIFCTEPYRVPICGKISHCLFDKTGTLTTDQLVPVGIVDISSVRDSAIDGNSKSSKPLDVALMSSVSSATSETALVLAACHSLVVVDDGNGDGHSSSGSTNDFNAKSNVVGDPIELAALEGVEWSWHGPTSTAMPGTWTKLSEKLQIVRQKLSELRALPQDKRLPNYDKQMESLMKASVNYESHIAESKQKAREALYQRVKVLQRYHFSSKLQRMSVLCTCADTSAEIDAGTGALYSLVKGSPEAIKSLLKPKNVPEWYTQCYESMARRGLRVLALAFKRIFNPPAEYLNNLREIPRSWVEADLDFAGFIAFECKIRADSSVVVQSLLESKHNVIMVTGDALLTSLHVANEVGICPKSKPAITLLSSAPDNQPNKALVGKPCWEFFQGDASAAEPFTYLPFSIESMDKLSNQYTFLTTEADLLAVAEKTGGAKTSDLWSKLDHFKVFARMSPQGKATIIQALQQGHITDANAANGLSNGTNASTGNASKPIKDVFVMMCGDGGNDVGALKQADIGLALLAGHANANTTETVANKSIGNGEGDGNANAATAVVDTAASEGSSTAAEDALNQHEKKLALRSNALNVKRQQHMKEYQAKFTKEQQIRMQEEVKKLTEKGEYMAMFSLMKNQAADMKKALDLENARFMAAHGQVWDPAKDGDAVQGTGLESMLGSLDTADAGGLPMVRPGDASTAAPFTSRIPSIRAVVNLIRQGRCTLLSALMQQQIMMLESTIAAYTLSALSLHNARSSERQMMASSWLIMTAAVSFSYASPVDHMHPLRPLKSLFHPAIIVSILGQAAIHIACMTLAVKWATDAMGPEKLQEVTEFFRKAKAKEIDSSALCGEDDFMCLMNAYWTAPFMPNLLNSVVFLVETSQMISVFFANYKGRPWMKGMLENHPLFLSVFLCIAGVIVAAWEMVPQVNELIQLAPFPDDAFRYKVVFLVVATIAGTFLWDRLCILIFAPDVAAATVGEAKKTSWKDVTPVLMTAAKVAGGLMLLGTGNILLIGLAIYWYRNYSSRKAQAELAAAGV